MSSKNSSSRSDSASSFRSSIFTSDASSDWRKRKPPENDTDDDSQVFRHYRSRWKPVTKKKNKKKNNNQKCRHSYGIICRNPKSDEYLAHRRKYSIGFEEMVRSNWDLSRLDLIESLCSDMSENERRELSNIENYHVLWSKMCIDENKKDPSSSFFLYALEKLKTLIDGYYCPENQATISWEKICLGRITHYNKPALGFPKGRRERIVNSVNSVNGVNGYENQLTCAKREFEEETGIGPYQYKILNLKPLQEVFTGINGYKYIYVYYLAEILPGAEFDPKKGIGCQEVDEIDWYNYQTILSLLRPRDFSRRKIFKSAHFYFTERSKYCFKKIWQSIDLTKKTKN
jgi:8-oxo-dGTP pyrophosphatase MutT (NUDIX family)